MWQCTKGSISVNEFYSPTHSSLSTRQMLKLCDYFPVDHKQTTKHEMKTCLRNNLCLHKLLGWREELISFRFKTMYSVGNNCWSPDIVRLNFENVQPISHYDQKRWPNISAARLGLSSSRFCRSINNYYVWSNLSNVWPKGKFERTYVLWIKKNIISSTDASVSFLR